jgi:hypothetical protein
VLSPLLLIFLLLGHQAALGAIRCYLALQDAPAAAAAAEEAAEAQLAALSPEERKKEKLRRKKVSARQITCRVETRSIGLVVCTVRVAVSPLPSSMHVYTM